MSSSGGGNGTTTTRLRATAAAAAAAAAASAASPTIFPIDSSKDSPRPSPNGNNNYGAEETLSLQESNDKERRRGVLSLFHGSGRRRNYLTSFCCVSLVVFSLAASSEGGSGWVGWRRWQKQYFSRGVYASLLSSSSSSSSPGSGTVGTFPGEKSGKSESIRGGVRLASKKEQPKSADLAAATGQSQSDPDRRRRRRKILSYTSSQWEKLWLSNIASWEKEKSICERILSPEQASYLSEFLNATCTYRIPSSDWCLVDSADGAIQTHWINTATSEVRKNRPLEHVPDHPSPSNLANQRAFDFVLPSLSSSSTSPSFLLLPENGNGEPAVFSKFVFVDEDTGAMRVEYIEPLVSHLRHPLAKCVLGQSLLDSPLVSSRAYVVPTSALPAGTAVHYYDAGASTWSGGGGLGGPSMSYFVDVWKRYGIDFDHIEGWEGRGSEERFMSSVPGEYRDRVKFHRRWITSNATEHCDETPFVPRVIRDNIDRVITKKREEGEGGAGDDASAEDVYVLFKLDIDSGDVERGTVDYILQSDERIVDEFLWEHHVSGNYLMMPNWKRTAAKGVTLDDSYRLFLALRQKGIRAHSWV